MSNRQGFSLAELVVGLVVASLVSASIVQLMVVQSRFMNTQEGRANARAVSRGAISLVESDLRMVQTSAGVVAAAADSITLRVPFAAGVICMADVGGSRADIMVPPVDSLLWAEDSANVAGYGWRDGSNTLTWFESSSMSIQTGSTTSCTSGSDPLSLPVNDPATRVIRIPQISSGYRGAAVFLHHKVTYKIDASTSVPGRMALYRRRWRANTYEELVAPFDSTAKFRFFWVDSANANASPPSNLSDLRGIELQLVGVNERAPVGTTGETSPLVTAVFFKN